MTTQNKKVLYLIASDNQRKFYGINNLVSGDSVLYIGNEDTFTNYIYTKKKVIGKWCVHKTDFGTAPHYLFSE